MAFDSASKAYLWCGGFLIGAGLFLVAVVGLPWVAGFGAVVMGLAVLAAPLIIHGVARSFKALADAAGSSWDGEILYADHGDRPIRYGFDARGQPWFVARDICAAIDAPTPGRLSKQWDMACFSADGVTQFLSARAINNEDARRLLVLLQQEVFRKLARESEREKHYGRG
jgi:hypothetical protein